MSLSAVIICLFSFLVLIAFYKKNSSIGRIFIWQNTLSVVNNNPFWGVGIGNFDRAYANSQASFFSSNPSSKFMIVAGDVRFAFNDYLQILTEQGLVGLFLFVTLTSILLFYSFLYFNRSILIQSCTLSICFILVTSFFTYSLQVIEIQVLFWILIAILVTEINKYTPSVKMSPPLSYSLILSVVSLLLGVTLTSYSINRWKAFLTFERFYNWEIGFQETNNSDFKAMLKYINDDPNFNIYYAENLWSSNRHNSAIKYTEDALRNIPEKELYYLLATFYEREKKYVQAVQCYEFVINYQPNILYPRYLLALFYKRTNNREMWLKSAHSVLSFKPKVSSNRTEMMKSEIRTKLGI